MLGERDATHQAREDQAPAGEVFLTAAMVPPCPGAMDMDAFHAPVEQREQRMRTSIARRQGASVRVGCPRLIRQH